jgi:hypothetical protein
LKSAFESSVWKNGLTPVKRKVDMDFSGQREM